MIMENPSGISERIEFVPHTRIPSSAREFVLFNEERQWTKSIPPFVTQLNEHVANLVGNGQLRDNDSHGLFDEAVNLYADVDFRDVPLYERSVSNLERMARSTGSNKVVMYGRDTDYLAMAVLAHEFGKPGVIGKPILLSISSDMAYGIKSYPDQVELVRKLFEQRGVDQTFIHVDVGKYGNVPKRLMQALWPNMTEAEINTHIKLIDPYYLRQALANRGYPTNPDKEMDKVFEAIKKDPAFRPIESLGEIAEFENLFWRMGYMTIENRPHFAQQARRFAEKEGQVFIPKEASDPRQQLLAWVVGQAVTRHFLPKQQKGWFGRLMRK